MLKRRAALWPQPEPKRVLRWVKRLLGSPSGAEGCRPQSDPHLTTPASIGTKEVGNKVQILNRTRLRRSGRFDIWRSRGAGGCEYGGSVSHNELNKTIARLMILNSELFDPTVRCELRSLRAESALPQSGSNWLYLEMIGDPGVVDIFDTVNNWTSRKGHRALAGQR